MMKIDKKQQKMLADFFKEETTWFPEHVAANLVAVIMIGIPQILYFIPYYEWKDSWEVFIYMIVIEMWGYMMYLTKFNSFKDDTKKKYVKMEKLMAYLPVSGEQMCLFQMRKIGKIGGILTIITICAQLLTSNFVYNELHILSSIGITIIFQFLLPIIMTFGDNKFRYRF